MYGYACFNCVKIVLLITGASVGAMICSATGWATEPVAKIGPWSLICASSIKQASDCAIAQATVSASGADPLRLSFAYQADQDAIMTVRTGPIFGPIKKASLLLDDKQVGFVAMNFCDEKGCSASVPVSKDALSAIQKSHSLALEIRKSETAGAYLPIDLADTQQALKRLMLEVYSVFPMPIAEVAGTVVKPANSTATYVASVSSAGISSLEDTKALSQQEAECSRLPEALGKPITIKISPYYKPERWGTAEDRQVSALAKLFKNCPNSYDLLFSASKSGDGLQEFAARQVLLHNGIGAESIHDADSPSVHLAIPHFE